MKEILLTKNTVTLVDDEDYERLNQFKWHISTGYAARYVHSIKKSSVYMHTEVLRHADKRYVVDHVDGNKLNNCKHNLRVCTQQQNSWNTNTPLRAASGYRGVYRNGAKWCARIKHNNKVQHIGNFNTSEEAAMAYDVAALEYRGEFAKLNYPQSNCIR